MTRELTPEEMQSTMDTPMRPLEDGDHTLDDLDFESFCGLAIETLALPIELDDLEIHYAYMNNKRDFCHVGFSFGDPNLYLVLVVQPKAATLHGFAVIDLNKLSD